MKINVAFPGLPLFVISAALAAQQPAFAEDVFYNLPVSSLKLMELNPSGSTHTNEDEHWNARSWELMPALQPYAILDGPGEAYVDTARDVPWEPGTLHIRAPKAAEITGRIIRAQRSMEGMTQAKFKVSPSEAKPDARAAFFKAKQEHYQNLQDREIPGAAWFRHQSQEAAKEAGGRTNSEPDLMRWRNRTRWNESGLEDTYDLFTGGRALSENLQLDRVLPRTATNEESVAIADIPGITVKEMNWKELIKDARPELDPLAAFLPADQHAIFFSSFQAMTLTVDEADANGTPVLQLLEPRSEDANSRSRYQKQLCLGLSELSRLFGPQVVASVAFTGSDPFLRVGTDVAIVFEARNPELLKSFIAAQQKAAQTAGAALAGSAAVKPLQGEIDGVAFTGVGSADRSVSSYLASISNVVYVSNSKSQLQNLIRVAKGGAPALSSQDEYRCFRMRYPRSDKSETAFIVLTDATIRRWCGPKWRIADSRRTRAAAAMSELQAAHVAELATGKAADAALSPGYYLPDAGEFRLTRAGVTSATYGTLDFMTPIVELPLERVTKTEADAYGRWRESYQRNWRQFFDPIAIRFSIAPEHLGAELTIMPLIAATDYREFIAFSSGAEIGPGAGDPHTNALLHLVFAINTQSQPVQEAGNFLGNMAPGLKANAFGWIGQSVAVYADEDEFWNRLLQSTNTDTFFEHNYVDLPLALYVEVKNPLMLAAFLTALHAFVDQSAPGMSTWQNMEYKSQAYVKITAKVEEEPLAKQPNIYYAATPRAFVVTLSEPMLKRALDRMAARSGADAKDPKSPAANPWPGKSISAAAERQFFEVLQRMMRETDASRLQLLAWNNLPALNEWKRLFPDQDPVKLHERLWGTRLLCPGGGTYVWNEKWQTMESTVFGHPGEPKTSANKALADVLSAKFGVSFENQGLSAKGSLERNVKE